MSNPFFRYLNSILKGPFIERDLFNEKDYSAFRMNVWLSMDPDLIKIVNMSCHPSMMADKYCHYLFLYHMVRKDKGKFLKYIGKDKEDFPIDKLKKIAKYFNYSLQEMKDNVHYLSDESIEWILEIQKEYKL